MNTGIPGLDGLGKSKDGLGKSKDGLPISDDTGRSSKYAIV